MRMSVHAVSQTGKLKSSGIYSFKNFPKFAFFISILFLLSVGSFSYGLAVVHYNVWPYRLIIDMKQAVISFYETGRIHPEERYMEVPKYASRKRFSIRDPRSVIPGYRAIVGYDNDAGRFVIWLFDETGEEQHIWPMNKAVLGIDSNKRNAAGPHGLKILQDGSVLVNFSGGSDLYRLDPCGKPIWAKEGFFHHSIDRSDNGSYWTWEGKNSAFAQYQFLVNFDPETGETIRRLSLIDDFIQDSRSNAVEFSIPPGFKFRSFDPNVDPREIRADIFHPNDLEELTSDLAIHFPQFSPGDLLVSLRSLDLVAVLDPEKKTVKWAQRGPWIQQHDPDFYPDGTIGVYDNNGTHGRSSIISIDPLTRKAKTKFAKGDLQFFSSGMGKHQPLPNGGELIVIPGEGRIVEVNSTGNIVFEFNNIVSEKFNVHVSNAIWLPPDFFLTRPACN